MKTLKGKSNSKNTKIGILMLVLSLALIGASTFAFFTYRLSGTSTLNFGKIQISDTDSNIKLTKTIDNLLPGDNLLGESETIKYTVDSGSQSLYSRVKFYFSTDSSVQAVNDYVDKLNSLGVNDWKLPSFSIGGNEMSSGTEYFWVKGDIYENNYYYLVSGEFDLVSGKFEKYVIPLISGDVVTFANSLVIPTTLTQTIDSNGNPVQYNGLIKMHIEIEAIQSTNYVGSDGTNNATLSNLSNTLNVKYATELLPTDSNYFTLTNNILTLNREYIDTHTLPTQIVIPSNIGGNKVLSIGEYGFAGSSNLISVKVPNSVTILDKSAFAGCSNLSEISLPKTITNINEFAFVSCTALKNIDMSNNQNLVGIDSNVFNGCTTLKTVNLSQCIKLVNIGETAFNGCSHLTDTNLSGCVHLKSMGQNTFLNCTQLVNIDLSGCINLLSIESLTFNGCTSLTNVDLSSCTSLINICENAFIFSNITHLILPNNIKNIDSSAFISCSELVSINFSDLVNLTNIGSSAFSSCTSLTSITIPSSVTSIGDNAFYNCSSLTSITFESTTGWYYTSDSTSWQNKTGGTTYTFSTTASENATYLKDNGADYYWYRVVA